jgi:hypothetical protein
VRANRFPLEDIAKLPLEKRQCYDAQGYYIGEPPQQAVKSKAVAPNGSAQDEAAEWARLGWAKDGDRWIRKDVAPAEPPRQKSDSAMVRALEQFDKAMDAAQERGDDDEMLRLCQSLSKDKSFEGDGEIEIWRTLRMYFGLFRVHTVRRNKLEERIVELERQVAESKAAFSYRGTWNGDTQYNENDFVTQSGSMWHCRRSTRDKPGQSDAWQLAVKRGADGRDAHR